MSAEMREFAAAFNHGLDRGVGMYEKEQSRAIQREHNKLLRDQHEATNRIQQQRTDLYGQSVKNAGALSAARAQALLNKGAKGPAAAPAQTDTNWIDTAFGQAGLNMPAAPAVPQVDVRVTGGGTPEAPDPAPISPPGFKKGGMVGKYAEGGMTVGEALSYGPKAGKDSGSAGTPGSAASSAFASAYEKSAAASQNKKEAPKPDVRPTGPVGSGAGGSYTTDDVQSGGVLNTTGEGYRRGGTVRKFQSGGRVMEAAIDTGTSGPGSGYGYRAAPPARRY